MSSPTIHPDTEVSEMFSFYSDSFHEEAFIASTIPSADLHETEGLGSGTAESYGLLQFSQVS